MSGVKHKTQLAEKRYRDKLEKYRKENILNTKSMRNNLRQLKKLIKFIKSIIIKYKKEKIQQNYKRKRIMNQIGEEL